MGTEDDHAHGEETELDSQGGGYTGGIIEWDHMDKPKYYILGSFAGLATRIVIYPFNLIKTRLYLQAKNSLYNGTWDAMMKIIRHEGARALYRGFLPYSFGILTSQWFDRPLFFFVFVPSLI